MSNFIEKTVEHELPTSGFKPNYLKRELLRSQKGLSTSDIQLKPTIRGFYQRDWVHEGTMQDIGRSYFLEIADTFRLGKYIVRPQFVFESGNKANYTASVGLDLGGNLGQLEVTHQAKNGKVNGHTEISHYFSTHKSKDLRNGLNARTTFFFQNLNSRANFRLSSTYTQTLELFNRKENKLTTKTSLYGVDTCLALWPLQQTSYSLYYQSKASNYDIITAFWRKSTDGKFFSNSFVTGIKYDLYKNMKFLAKASYNVDNKRPQLDLMIRNTNSQDPRLKTFHKISTDLKATSGISFGTQKFKIQGLAEVNFRNNDANCQPFSLSFKVETNDQIEFDFSKINPRK